MSLDLKIDTKQNFITICGENNTGKTNTLRALNLFFRPDAYKPEKDAPHHKWKGTRGGAVHPEISLHIEDNNGEKYKITRKFTSDGDDKYITSGMDLTNDSQLEKTAIEKILNRFSAFFVESINISFPNLIRGLIEELYDVEFESARFRGLKATLKTAFDEYRSGILDILQKLATEVSPLFRDFKDGWGISFDIKHSIEKFRDLITDDIEFFINDGSNKIIEGKGSGLQRLAYLLIHMRIIEKLKSNKTAILFIDEPDLFLHQGLEKKLRQLLAGVKEKCQVIITTHSPFFIDSYTLQNVFLLELQISEKFYHRTNTSMNVLETTLVDINKSDGAKKIRDYIGIDLPPGILDSYNIIVEGDCDKEYISKLMKYFKLSIPNIITANGVRNISNLLDLYNSIYENEDIKPKVLMIYDNDTEGREEYKHNYNKRFTSLVTKHIFLPTFLGEVPDTQHLNRVLSNYEVEDFMFPEIICSLSNLVLKKGGYKTLNIVSVCKKIHKPAWKERGILNLLENEKNQRNPDKGNKIDMNSMGVKKGMSQLFQLEGNKDFIDQIDTLNTLYPEVYRFLENISDINNVWPTQPTLGL